MKFLLRPGLFSVAFAPSFRVGKHNQVTQGIFHGIFTFTLPETNISPLNIALFVSGGVMFVQSPQKACLVALPKSLMSKAIFQVPRLLSSYKPWKQRLHGRYSAATVADATPERASLESQNLGVKNVKTSYGCFFKKTRRNEFEKLKNLEKCKSESSNTLSIIILAACSKNHPEMTVPVPSKYWYFHCQDALRIGMHSWPSRHQLQCVSKLHPP